MAMMKRIFLFLLMNFLVVMTISFVLRLLGIQPYLHAQYGMDYQQLMIFCLVWGFGGAFISLALSRVMAKYAMGVKIIDPQSSNMTEQNLLETVHNLARAAGLSTMPQVGYYESPEVNAFATGPTRSRSLVAVSTGLLNTMDKKSVEGVLAHEIAHVANGDMVTMTLLQGIVNAFVMFLARVIAFALASRRSDDDERSSSPFMQYMLIQVLEMVLMIFGSMLVAWFSRYREFRADAGGARLAGRDSMIAALRSLQRMYERPSAAAAEAAASQPASLQAFKISGGGRSFLRLFSTHPPLEDRIAALETATNL